MILIIAYGNDLREDDGAGLVLAERLASIWQSSGLSVQLAAVQQLTPELAADIGDKTVTAVIFVDTRMMRSPSDRSVAVVPLEPATEASPSMGHHVQPGVLLAYAQALYVAEILPPAWLVTVPGVKFGYGEFLSDVALSAIREAFEDDNSQLRRQVIGPLSAPFSVRGDTSWNLESQERFAISKNGLG